MSKKSFTAAEAEAWARENLGRTVSFPLSWGRARAGEPWLEAVVVGWSTRQQVNKYTGVSKTIHGFAGAMAGPLAPPPAEHRVLQDPPAGRKVVYLSIEYVLEFGRVGPAPGPAVDLSRYPHVCPVPGCGKPAYVGLFTDLDCSAGHRRR